MLEMVKERLHSFGYELKDGDEAALTFCIQKVEQTIKNDCSVPAVPDELLYIAADMAIGEFLRWKKTFFPDDISESGFDIGGAVKQIQLGDANVTFAVSQNEGSMTDEQRLDSFIDYLLTYGRDQFSCFRRLRW